jgi:Toprim-like
MWTIISEHDLDDPRTSGDWIRAVCHLHKGDHQRSLSINQATGFGQCHNCKEQVLVREFNPDAASNITRKEHRLSRGDVRVIDPRVQARRAREQQKEVRSTRLTAPPQWQVEEVRLLRELYPRMRARLEDDRAQAYLAERGIALATAKQWDVGYIPAIRLADKYKAIAKWTDHLIFPVESPVSGGMHFVGRNLRLWHPGMDEDEHKLLLEAREQALRDQGYTRAANSYGRWLKTHNGGWFPYELLDDAEEMTFCEGPFDALALLEAGLYPVGLIGTALTLEWLPKTLQRVILAYDNDKAGREAAFAAHRRLWQQGFTSWIVLPPDDDRGQDWSARYRKYGDAGVSQLIFALSPLSAYEEQTA